MILSQQEVKNLDVATHLGRKMWERCSILTQQIVANSFAFLNTVFSIADLTENPEVVSLWLALVNDHDIEKH